MPLSADFNDFLVSAQSRTARIDAYSVPIHLPPLVPLVPLVPPVPLVPLNKIDVYTVTIHRLWGPGHTPVCRSIISFIGCRGACLLLLACCLIWSLPVPLRYPPVPRVLLVACLISRSLPRGVNQSGPARCVPLLPLLPLAAQWCVGVVGGGGCDGQHEEVKG